MKGGAKSLRLERRQEISLDMPRVSARPSAYAQHAASALAGVAATNEAQEAYKANAVAAELQAGMSLEAPAPMYPRWAPGSLPHMFDSQIGLSYLQNPTTWADFSSSCAKPAYAHHHHVPAPAPAPTPAPVHHFPAHVAPVAPTHSVQLPKLPDVSIGSPTIYSPIVFTNSGGGDVKFTTNTSLINGGGFQGSAHTVPNSAVANIGSHVIPAHFVPVPTPHDGGGSSGSSSSGSGSDGHSGSTIGSSGSMVFGSGSDMHAAADAAAAAAAIASAKTSLLPTLGKKVVLQKINVKNRSAQGLKLGNVSVTSAGGGAVLPAGKILASGASAKLVNLNSGPINAHMVHVTLSGVTKTGGQVSATYIVPLDSMKPGVQFSVNPVKTQGDSRLKPLVVKHSSSGVLTLTVA